MKNISYFYWAEGTDACFSGRNGLSSRYSGNNVNIILITMRGSRVCRRIEMSAVEMVIRSVALFVGVIWIWMNAYQFYPVLTHLLGTLVRTGRTEDSPAEQEAIQMEADGGQSGDDTSLRPDGGVVDLERLPEIDLFIPAYEEGSVIDQAISSIRANEYPQDLLNVVVLLEPDDEDTRSALQQLSERFDFETITVPDGYPGDPNKPRALNYAYEQTSAELVGVVDAEDIVAPDLCQRVATKLMTGHDFAQSRLDMVNEDDGWLNTMFRAEYGYWYETSITGFAKRDFPIPMAGTTCFFRRDVLDEMSDRRLAKFGDPWDVDEWQWLADHGLDGLLPWDPENVTEDFELGMFLWQEGYKFAYVDTVTQGESPLSLDAWVKQRTRWQKGKVYTFKQYLSNPPKGLGSKLHVFTQSAVPHLGAINFSAMLIVLLGANLFRSYTPRPSTLAVLNISLVFGFMMMGVYSYGYWTVSNRPRWTRLRRALVVFVSLPVYWLLQWIADVRALKQVYSGRLHWAKTTHIGRNNEDASGVNSIAAGSRDLRLSRRVRWGSLAAILCTGLGLRLYNLAERSLYGDELYSVTRASLPLPELLTVPLSLDSHPPLYYTLLHYWMEAFGSSTFAVRAMTVCLAGGTLLGLYWLGTELFDDRVGLLAALLYSVSSFYIHFGRVARMYSLVTLLTVLSWYGFVRLRDSQLSTDVFYTVASGLLLYTHVYGLFVVLAQNLYMFLSEARNGVSLRRWASLQAVLGLIATPWLVTLFLRVFNLDSAGADLVNWIPEPDGLRSIIQSLSRFVGYPVHYPFLQGTADAPLTGITSPWALSWVISALLLALFVVCALASVVRFTPSGTYEISDLRESSQLGLLFLSPILAPFILSYILAPVYWTRYTIPASIGFVLLVANGVTNVDSKHIRRGLVAIVVVSSLFTAGVYHSQSSVEDWGGQAACLNAGAEEDDLVVYQPAWIQPRLDYYEVDDFEKRTVPQADSVTDQELERLQNATQSRDEVWLLRYHPGGEPQTDDAVFTALNTTYDERAAAHDGAFSVYRFARSDNGEPDEMSNMSSMCPSSEVQIW